MYLDERKYRILQAIIDDYILTAIPVGSRTVARKPGVGFSPATIRNEMSDLEELGYLDQPHTSAGRIPSAKAYRLYVDQLLKVSQLSEDEADRIKLHMDTRVGQIEQLIKYAAHILSDVTQYTSIVVAPKLDHLLIQRLQIVPVSSNSALMVVVTNAGIVKDLIISIPEDMESDHLYAISRLLTEKLSGVPLSAVKDHLDEMISILRDHASLIYDVFGAIEDRLSDASEQDVVVGGRSKLLSYPEYSDIEKAKTFLSVLESREKLYPLLKNAQTMEFTIRIGPEIDVPEFSDCSIISASYRIGDHSTGTMGIIGPTRMQYGRVLSVLDFMGKALGNLLK